MMEQLLFNVVIGAVCGIIGFFGKTIWAATRKLVDDLAAFREEVAKDYMRKDDFNRVADQIFHKLDQIWAKLDHKADK